LNSNFQERHYEDAGPDDEAHVAVAEYKEMNELYRRFFREFYVENFGFRYR
jgi:hypothetical protein